MVKRALLLLSVATLWACEDPCDGPNMLESAGGLTVTQAEHPTGWGEPTCSDCHAYSAIHRNECVAIVDPEPIEEEGDASCVACHGGNGWYDVEGTP